MHKSMTSDALELQKPCAQCVNQGRYLLQHINVMLSHSPRASIGTVAVVDVSIIYKTPCLLFQLPASVTVSSHRCFNSDSDSDCALCSF